MTVCTEAGENPQDGTSVVEEIYSHVRPTILLENEGVQASPRVLFGNSFEGANIVIKRGVFRNYRLLV
jgi:hypothetical protein